MAQQEQGNTESAAAYIEKLSESRNEPAWLTRFRLGAWNQYESLPEEQSNLYSKYALNLRFDLEDLLGKKADVVPSPASLPLAQIAEGIESGAPYYVASQTEIFASKALKKLDAQGIVFCDFHEALEKQEPMLRKIFENKAIQPQEDKYAALNSALFSSGWLVYIPRNAELQSALRIRSYLNSNSPSISQTWVVAEEQTSVSIQTENYGAEIEGLTSELVEIYLRDGATVRFSNIQNYSELTTVLANKKAICSKDSTIRWTLGYFGGKETRARMESVFTRDGASAEDVEVVFGNNTQKFDLVSDLVHYGAHTKGRILANSVLKDKSKSIFKGMIRIGKEAKNSNAYLAGHAILLSPEAKSDAIPGLEILTNDVKATHSASVSQIDEDQIFYMMTRGLSNDEARKFIVLGFLEPAISRIDSEELRDTMRDLIEAKWYGIAGLRKQKKQEVLFEEEEKGREAGAIKDIFEGHYKYR